MKAAAIASLIVNRKWLFVFLSAFLFALFSILYSLISNPVFAQDECTPSDTFSYGGTIDEVNKCSIEKNIFDDKIFNYNQLVGTADSLNVLITGYSLNHPETNSITADASALAGMSRGVALAFAAPPASGVEYFAQKIKEVNPVKPAYAQEGGIGYAALSPVQRIWTILRNASYVGFIIVFVIMGFMIMFRAHISPQAVATVQDSIPRIVIALILVTFSYAIAGLFIDMMYIIINMMIALFGLAGLDTAKAQIFFRDNIFTLIGHGWMEMVATTSEAISETLTSLFGSILQVGGCSITDPGGCISKGVAWILGWIGAVILGIALLFIMVKIFFMLLIAYVTIILLTIAAPFFFLFQALPGNNGAKEWFKQMAANVAIFPTVVLMFLLAALIGGIGDYGASQSVLGDEDLYTFPLLTGGFNAKQLGQLIAIGLILMTPQAADLIKGLIGAKGPQGMGAAGGAALGAAAGAVASPITGGPVRGVARHMGFEATRATADRITGRKFAPHAEAPAGPAAQSPETPPGRGGRS